MTVQQHIRRFILDDVGWDGDPAVLTDDLPLFNVHVLDSMGLYELIEGLERAYRLRIPPEDVHPGNFGTIAAIARYVHGRAGAVAEPRA